MVNSDIRKLARLSTFLRGYGVVSLILFPTLLIGFVLQTPRGYYDGIDCRDDAKRLKGLTTGNSERRQVRCDSRIVPTPPPSRTSFPLAKDFARCRAE
jgi:hypothetical protein